MNRRGNTLMIRKLGGRGGIGVVVGFMLAVSAVTDRTWAADDPPATAAKPIRALLITGGPFHNYKRQTEILQEGLKSRCPVEWTVVREEKMATDAKVARFDQPGWADGFDVVIHNECFADQADRDYIARVVAVHKAGVPAVVVHCAMHTFRSLKTDEWHEFLGVTTTSHGPQHPLEVRNDQPEHPIMRGFPATWTTGNEELYKIDKLWPDSEALASAVETNGKRYPVLWTHQYGAGRVFGTTLPHNDKTMSDPVFLDLFARGLLWATDRLDAEGKPKAGSAPIPAAANPAPPAAAPALDEFTVAGVTPRAFDADAPLAEGWPPATPPGTIAVKSFPAYRSAVARGRDGTLGGEAALFYPLFVHISRREVAMTAPVLSTIDPKSVASRDAKGDMAMEFVYRNPTTGEAGPGVGAVVVEDRPAGSFVCLGVQGKLDADRLRRGIGALESWLGEHKAEWTAAGPPRQVGYHPPMVDEKSRWWEIQIPVVAAAKSP